MAEAKSVVKTLKDIGQSLDIEKVTGAVSAVVAKESKDPENTKKVFAQIARIGLGVRDVLDKDYTKKIVGLLTIVSAFRELVPLVIPLAKDFAKFMASVLGFAGGIQSDPTYDGACGAKNESREEIVLRMFTYALDVHEDNRVKSEADSACRLLMFSHNVLVGANSDTETAMSEHEVSGLITLVDINAGVKALGQIESRIWSMMESVPKSTSEEILSSYSQRVIQYVDMYCRLATLRDAVMWEMYAVLSYCGHSDHLAAGIRTSLCGEHERDRSLVNSLVLPKEYQVHFASCFDSERWPFIQKFMENYTAFDAVENLDNVPVVMNTMKWMNWFVSHDSNIFVRLRSTHSELNEPLDKTHYNFLLVRKENSTCYYISPQCLAGTYLVMSDGDKKWVELRSGKPGREGEWNIFNLQDRDSVYMLATRRWPVHFLTMSDTWIGRIHGRTVSITDPSAHWIIRYNGSKV